MPPLIATLVWDNLTYFSCREEISRPAPAHSELRRRIVCSGVDACQRRQESSRRGPFIAVGLRTWCWRTLLGWAQLREGLFRSAWTSGAAARKGRAMATKASGAS